MKLALQSLALFRIEEGKLLIETNTEVPGEEIIEGNTLTMDGKLGLNTLIPCFAKRDTSAISFTSRVKLPADSAGILRKTFKVEPVAVFTKSCRVRAAVPFSVLLASRMLHCNRLTAFEAVIDVGIFARDKETLNPWAGPDEGNK